MRHVVVGLLHSHAAGTALAGILAVLLAGGLDMKATLAVRQVVLCMRLQLMAD